MSVSTSVYMAYDAAGALLYVGCSGNVAQRLKQHKSNSLWFELMASHKVRVYPTRDRALDIEGRAIKILKPKYNGGVRPRHLALRELDLDALPEAPSVFLCTECYKRVSGEDVLTAPHPFDDNDIVSGCPHCFAVDPLTSACVVDGCCEQPSQGNPNCYGFRYAWTCRKHHEKRKGQVAT